MRGVCVQVEMTNKARQHLVKGSIVCEAIDYTGKVEPLECCVSAYLPLSRSLSLSFSLSLSLSGPQVLRDMETMKVAKKVNKGKTESVSMTIGGSIFSEYPRNKVGWVL